MTNLDHLFTFPIVMVDGDNEERKMESMEKMGIENNDEDVDMIEGEACVPYYDFISVSDRWLPTTESAANALNRTFDACGVLFANSGTFIVPWSKERFKKELLKFMSKQDKEVITITKKEASDFITKLVNE